MGLDTDFHAADQHGETGIHGILKEPGGNVDTVAFSGPLSSNMDRVAFSGPLSGQGDRVASSGPLGGSSDRVAFSGPLGGSAHRVAFSGPLSGPLNKRPGRGSVRFNIPDDGATSSKSNSRDEGYVEITFDVMDDSIAVHRVKPAGPGDQEDPEIGLLAKDLEKRSSFGSSVTRNASARIKHMSQELKHLSFAKRAPYPGRLDRSKPGAHSALQGLKFITNTEGRADWNLVEQRFDELAVDGSLSRALFGHCIGMRDSREFAGELFDALARRRGISGPSITKDELKEFWEQISDESFDSRLQTFLDMVDKNADGRIPEEKVKEFIQLIASANKLSRLKEKAEEFAALIMEELDPDLSGYIEIQNLKMLFLEVPNENAKRGNTSANWSQMISQKLAPTKINNPVKRWLQKTKFFVEDNWQRIWVLLLWLCILAGLFTWKFIQYRHRAVYHVMGYCVCTDKGAAETLKFNMALILLPVCRNTITWLRNKTKLGVAVPFDDNLNFHKVIAVAIAIGVGLHAGAHLTCDFPRLLHASNEEYVPMQQFFGHNRPPNYWWFVKGVEGVTGVIMVVFMAIAFVLATPWFRRNKLNLPKPLKRLTGFNAFWYSHHLFVIVYVLLIVHGIYLYLSHKWYKKTTWMYLAVPVLLYGGERTLRAFRSGYKSVKILKAVIHPGNFLSLHVSKPQGFKYKSGQYMFVNCPAVSSFEWHPFSIASAPGDDFLSVHIQTLGDWTSELKYVFSRVCEPPRSGKSGLLTADYMQGENNPSFPRLLIDGPYGAPAQDYRKYDVLLLVGIGIGAAPFISIMKDLVNNMKLKDEESDHLENGSKHKKKTFNTNRAYFYWVTREPRSFEWFEDIMNEVAEIDDKGIIELHNYCTSVYEEGDARSALISVLQALNHAKNGVDIVSGTRVKTHFFRPNWRNVFKKVAVKHKDERVGVFYCGAPVLSNELRQLALDFTRKTSTRFDFHKEYF